MRFFGLGLGLLALLVLTFLPSALHRVPGFGHRPAYAAGVASLMAILWLTEAIPIAYTACIPLLAYPAFGVFGKGFLGDLWVVSQHFVDGYIFLFLGGMVLGAAMEEWNLHRRLALHVLKTVGTRPRGLLFGVLLATAAVSMWISNTATAVMMMPIALALASQLESRHKTTLPTYSCALLLAVAYGSNIGGVGTKIGTGTNSIFCGYVADRLGIEIGFLQYMGLGVPFVLLFLPIAFYTLLHSVKDPNLPDEDAKSIVVEELARLGPMGRNERIVAIVFAIAAVFWILGDVLRPLMGALLSPWLKGAKLQGKIYEAGVAMGAAFLLGLLGVLRRSTFVRIPWSTLVLLGGSFAMAGGIEGSGLSSWMGSQLKSIAALPPFQQVALASLSTVVLTAVASNTATVNVALNVLPPRLPLLAATTIAASCDFMLPAGTPPNAIVFGSGRVRLPTMMRIGFMLDMAAVVVTTVYAYTVTPWVFPSP